MLVQASVQFLDRKAQVVRQPGETFEASTERVRALNTTVYGTLVTVVDSTEPERELEPEPEPESTVKDIKAMLDARGVEYRTGMRKAELLDLL